MTQFVKITVVTDERADWMNNRLLAAVSSDMLGDGACVVYVAARTFKVECPDAQRAADVLVETEILDPSADYWEVEA